MTGGNNRPVKTHDVSFADSMSDEFRVEHGFTFATLLLRFPILTVLMKDMQEGIIHSVEPTVSYTCLEEITQQIYLMYDLPTDSVIPFLR